MVAALELAQHGVPCIVVEQAERTTEHPKMDIVNTRSMELLDRLGLAEPIRAAGVGAEHPSDVIWSTGLAGEPITTWHQPSVAQFWQRIHDDNDGSQPAQPWQRLSQIALEPLLRQRCRRHPLIDLRCGWRLTAVDQDLRGVTSTLEIVGQAAEASIRSEYLLGCDGAASQVRQAIGVDLTNFAVPDLAAAYMIHFRSHDLGTLHRHGRFWHYFAFRYVILAQDEVDSWTLHVNSDDAREFDTPPADPARFLRQVLGTDLRVEAIELTSRWRPNFALAERYRRGRVLLAGDAAHQMFPTGGYGMNTGIADAVDAAWKLAMLVNRLGGSTLLDSYDCERRPVALRNLYMSRRHLDIHMTAGQRVRNGTPLSEVAAFLQAERGENEYAGIELGYRYNDSPIVWRDSGVEPTWRPQRYTPTSWPGGRPPSVLMEDGRSIFNQFGNWFTLVDFVGDGRANELLHAAAGRGLPMRHVMVRSDSVRELWERDLVLVRPDQHIGWRGNRPPQDADAVLAHLVGRCERSPCGIREGR